MLRGRHLLLLDVASTALSFVSALALRFDAPSPLFDAYFRVYSWAILPLLIARISAFLWLRLYQRVWRYASIDELISVLIAVTASSAIGYAFVFGLIAFDPVLSSPGFPRSVPLIDTFLMVSLAGGWRFALRVIGAGRFVPVDGVKRDRALIVGTGTATLAVLRDLRSNSTLGLRAVGLLSDDVPVGQRIMGLPVLGGLGDFGDVVSKERVAAVLLALPSADGRTLRRLVREAESLHVRCLTVPSMAEIVAGRVTMNAVRDIAVEDLLRRSPARIDTAATAGLLHDRVVLVTGAGGSIGSELCRQLVRFDPSRLVMLGRGENSVFEAAQSLSSSSKTEVLPVIADVRDGRRIEETFRALRPSVVFHAAAHKHVSLMEQYPEEAVSVNILGTANVLRAAEIGGVERLVSVSTDKAVNPTSVMGATKRVSEILTVDSAYRRRLPYVVVRFGNVLSSRGSVLPTFRSQLARGGPLTITHPDATRFFMTIPEAVQLVLQAAVLAEPGDTFVLDMGEPVRIVQLAQDLVELHGLTIGRDVDLQFVGLRPGEKLDEELFFDWERPEPTAHDAIRRVRQTEQHVSSLHEAMTELLRAAAMGQRQQVINGLRRLVPEYTPSRSDNAVSVDGRSPQIAD